MWLGLSSFICLHKTSLWCTHNLTWQLKPMPTPYTTCVFFKCDFSFLFNTNTAWYSQHCQCSFLIIMCSAPYQITVHHIFVFLCSDCMYFYFSFLNAINTLLLPAHCCFDPGWMAVVWEYRWSSLCRCCLSMPHFYPHLCAGMFSRFLYLSSGVLVKAETDPLAELQWAAAD